MPQMLRDRDRAQEEAKGRLRRLRDDFQYNLALIEERDAELDRWGFLFGALGGFIGVGSVMHRSTCVWLLQCIDVVY